VRLEWREALARAPASSGPLRYISSGLPPVSDEPAQTREMTLGHPSVTVWMTRLITGGRQSWTRSALPLWAEDSGGRELEDPGSLAKVRGALQDAGAPEGELFYRRENEHYGRAAERAAADIIVEDDCESIGGPAQMTYPKLGPDSKARTKSVVIPEWGGIDHLPTDP